MSFKVRLAVCCKDGTQCLSRALSTSMCMYVCWVQSIHQFHSSILCGHRHRTHATAIIRSSLEALTRCPHVCMTALHSACAHDCDRFPHSLEHATAGSRVVLTGISRCTRSDDEQPKQQALTSSAGADHPEKSGYGHDSEKASKKKQDLRGVREVGYRYSLSVGQKKKNTEASARW